jgi:hypothetical protein
MSPARAEDRTGRPADAGRAAVGAEAGTERARLARIEFEDVRGAQVGDHVVQVNTFVVRPRETKLDFAEVLRRPDVVRAMRELQEHPGDTARRVALVEALSADTGWSIWSRPVTLDVGAPQRNGFGELLRGLLAFDVRGLQVGDHTRQTNRFVYTVPSLPTATDLLRDNSRLAVALADYLCPPSGVTPDVAQLQQRLAGTVTELPIAWHDGRLRNLHVYPPGDCDAVKIRHTDGVVVGNHVRQEVTEVVELRRVTVDERLRATAAATARAAAGRPGAGELRAPAEMSVAERRAVEDARAEAVRMQARAQRAYQEVEKAGRVLAAAELAAERALVDAERAAVRETVARDEALGRHSARLDGRVRTATAAARDQQARAAGAQTAVDQARKVLSTVRTEARHVGQEADRLVEVANSQVQRVHERIAAEERVRAERLHEVYAPVRHVGISL